MSAFQLPPAQVSMLKGFIALIKTKPEYLHEPTLAFFKDYLVSLGASIPDPEKKKEEQPAGGKCPFEEGAAKKEEATAPKMEEEPAPEVESDPESEVELDMEGVIGESDRLDFSYIIPDLI